MKSRISFAVAPSSSSSLAAHYGRKQPRKQTEVLGHSLVHSLVCSHRSLVCLLRTARFARALRCTHSFVRSHRSLRSFTRSWESEFLMSQNDLVLSHSGWFVGGAFGRRRLHDCYFVWSHRQFSHRRRSLKRWRQEASLYTIPHGHGYIG